MRIALLIALKDLRQRLRDRSALLVSIAAPLGLAVIFSQLLSGATGFGALISAQIRRPPAKNTTR